MLPHYAGNHNFGSEAPVTGPPLRRKSAKADCRQKGRTGKRMLHQNRDSNGGQQPNLGPEQGLAGIFDSNADLSLQLKYLGLDPLKVVQIVDELAAAGPHQQDEVAPRELIERFFVPNNISGTLMSIAKNSAPESIRHHRCLVKVLLFLGQWLGMTESEIKAVRAIAGECLSL